VLSQQRSDFELLVVDDGSTDGTTALLTELAHDARVRPLRQAHSGISAAMNLALRHARGAFVARIDSDDEWSPDLLMVQVGALEAHPEADVVHARACVVRDGNRSDEVWGHAPRYAESALASMLYSDFTCNITVVARRECIQRLGGYDESLETSEDFDLWLRAAVQHRFLFVDRVLATVHVQHDSISFDPIRMLRNRSDRERALDKLFARQDLPIDAAGMKATAYANLHTESALRYWSDRQPRAAWRALCRALLQEGQRARVLARFCFFALANGPLRHQAWWRALPRAVRRYSGGRDLTRPARR
jgi:glycosyltransferase involved in cell wall biosynthesis